MRVAASIVLAALAVGGMAAGAAALAQTPVAAGAYTVEPYSPSSPILIQGTGVRLRAEPFATPQTPVLSSGSTGLALNVVGIARMPDWSWYQVVLRNGQKAFIRSDLTTAPMPGGRAPVNLAPAPAPASATPPAPQPRATLPPQPGAITMTPQPNPAAAQPPPRPSQTPAPVLNLPLPAPAAAPAPAPAPAPSNTDGLFSIAPAAPTPRLQPTAATLSALVMGQLVDKRCWTDSSSMLDAHRLKATFSMSFGRDGRFAAEPVLINPPLAPADDPAMQVFIAKARAALRTCNALGFQIPPEYFTGGAPSDVRVEFSAR